MWPAQSPSCSEGKLPLLLGTAQHTSKTNPAALVCLLEVAWVLCGSKKNSWV